MTGVLDGIKVLDLSTGISGPMATMMLGDHGAHVTKIEPANGDPGRAISGTQVWHRNKRSACLDLEDPGDRAVLDALMAQADVFVENFAPVVARSLGLDPDSVRDAHPHLVHATVTGYGLAGQHTDRPIVDALVAARTGQQWEVRGVEGGTIARLAGVEGMMPGLVAPEGCWVGTERKGPVFSGIPWPSMSCFYLLTLGISAALRARTITGKGQHVHTSLLQGILCSTLGGWQRVENPDVPFFQTWIIDPRAPKGFFRASDGVWTHHWVPLPGFVMAVSEGDEMEITEEAASPRTSATRIGTHPDDMVLLHHYTPLMAERVAKYPSADWVRAAAEVGAPVQAVRSPEQALVDQLFLDDGCVIEVDDPVLGPVRQVGQVYNLSACPTTPPTAPAHVGQHTDEVRAEAGRAPEGPRSVPTGTSLASPLEGIVVLDLGLAVAGPFGTQLLSDLGATVIKVSTHYDEYWMSNHIALCCNRGKRSVAIDLKHVDGLAVLHELVRRADIVQHNMRYDAAVRLGVDDQSLRAINPSLIYCHTRGFEKGPRAELPGNDQTGSALAGGEWVDGGLDNDGNPIWSITSMGDTGNGFLSAIAMVQALYHRDRTGEGQFVDTSIVYAQLLNNSMAWTTPDGSARGDRPSLDADQLGWHALYSLYATTEGWLCIAADATCWPALCRAVGLGELVDDERFADAPGRKANDTVLRSLLKDAFEARTAREWFDLLDAAGVPCEVSSPDFVLDVFDDPEMIEKGWVTSYPHPTLGKIDVMGLLVDLSDTPGVVQGPPFLPGQHSVEILSEAGFSEDDIQKLIANQVILDRS